MDPSIRAHPGYFTSMRAQEGLTFSDLDFHHDRLQQTH